MHEQQHPLAGQTVEVDLRGTRPGMPGGDDRVTSLRIEDWGDRVFGKSVIHEVHPGNWAVINYGARLYLSHSSPNRAREIPFDDEVVYGKFDNLGYLVHITEIKE